MLEASPATAFQYPLMLLPAYLGTESIAEAIQTARGQWMLWLEILVNEHLDLSPWASEPAVQQAYQTGLSMVHPVSAPSDIPSKPYSPTTRSRAD